MTRRFLYFRSKLARFFYRWLPIRMSGAVAIIRRGEEFLVIERADTLGCCFPGGLSKRSESEEDTIRRELLEETGLVMTSASFLFRYREKGGFSEFTSVYEVRAVGDLRASNEGLPLWLRFPDLLTRCYLPQRPILEYLSRSSE